MPEPLALPLPTIYQGVPFRSRLEARWAYFFERLGLAWEYEPGGVVLAWDGRAIPYAPDFFVRARDWACAVEVKPETDDLEALEGARFLVERYAEQARRAILLVVGPPGRREALCREPAPNGGPCLTGTFDFAYAGCDPWTVREAARAANGTWWDRRAGGGP